jgi:hypothetical protein
MLPEKRKAVSISNEDEEETKPESFKRPRVKEIEKQLGSTVQQAMSTHAEAVSQQTTTIKDQALTANASKGQTMSPQAHMRSQPTGADASCESSIGDSHPAPSSPPEQLFDFIGIPPPEQRFGCGNQAGYNQRMPSTPSSSDEEDVLVALTSPVFIANPPVHNDGDEHEQTPQQTQPHRLRPTLHRLGYDNQAWHCKLVVLTIFVAILNRFYLNMQDDTTPCLIDNMSVNGNRDILDFCPDGEDVKCPDGDICKHGELVECHSKDYQVSGNKETCIMTDLTIEKLVAITPLLFVGISIVTAFLMVSYCFYCCCCGGRLTRNARPSFVYKKSSKQVTAFQDDMKKRVEEAQEKKYSLVDRGYQQAVSQTEHGHERRLPMQRLMPSEKDETLDFSSENETYLLQDNLSEEEAKENVIHLSPIRSSSGWCGGWFELITCAIATKYIAVAFFLLLPYCLYLGFVYKKSSKQVTAFQDDMKKRVEEAQEKKASLVDRGYQQAVSQTEHGHEIRLPIQPMRSSSDSSQEGSRSDTSLADILDDLHEDISFMNQEGIQVMGEVSSTRSPAEQPSPSA